MPPPTDALAPWHAFYALLGEASATMVALLFVAASVGAGVFSGTRPTAARVFLSASVVNFGLILALALVILAPLEHLLVLGALVIACGLFGFGHTTLAWRGSLQDGLIARIDTEDRVWYLALPALGYLCVIASGVGLAAEAVPGCVMLAVAMAVLLITGVHNAWDITLWVITRQRE